MPLSSQDSSPQLSLSFDSRKHIYQVSEINAALQGLFSREFSNVWIAGEISGLRTSSAGHHYFCLKDPSNQIKCVLFKNAARYLRTKPQDGLAVAAQGNLEIYPARGEYQLIVDRLELHGTGSLQVAFDQLKAQLHAEGLFNAERKRPLPRYPRRIGIVSSPSGAALQDILHVIGRRFPGMHIRLFPAQVQGEGAAEQLCSGLDYFSTTGWPEVLILTRGGGSLEDLWSFNDERVARAIARSSIPVISAVGHETDFTISDFVADHRAPTPSAAAEIVICTRESLLTSLDELRLRMRRSVQFRLLTLLREVDGRSGDRGTAQIRRMISQRMQRVDGLEHELRALEGRRLALLSRQLMQLTRRLEEANLPLRFARIRQRQEALSGQLAKCWNAAYWRNRQRLDVGTSHLIQLSPLSVLARGYAIVETTSRTIVRAASETQVGTDLSIRLHQGSVKASVTEVDPGL